MVEELLPSPVECQNSQVVLVIIQLLILKYQSPGTWKQAMRSPNAEQRKKAVEAEYQSLMKHGTWDLVPLLHGKKLVSVRWVLRVKHDENGQV